jgi:hypothetical protein
MVRECSSPTSPASPIGRSLRGREDQQGSQGQVSDPRHAGESFPTRLTSATGGER